MCNPIYIALGANLGDPVLSFRKALVKLEEKGVSIKAVSGLWQSPAWPAGQAHPDYINACAQVEFNGSARELLSIMHEVEKILGRERTTLNAPRPLDLDLIDFCGSIIERRDITIPHPRMMDRAFVLLPLSQLNPNWSSPLTSISINAAIARLPLNDVSPVKYLGRKDSLLASPTAVKSP